MANVNEFKIVVEQKIEKSKERLRTLESKGAFKDQPQALEKFQSMISDMEKITSWDFNKKANVKNASKTFKRFSDSLNGFIDSFGGLSEEYKASKAAIETARKKLSASKAKLSEARQGLYLRRDEAGNITKKGLTSSYISEFLQKQGGPSLHFQSGKEASWTSDTAIRAIMSGQTEKFATQDQEKAKQLHDKLQKEFEKMWGAYIAAAQEVTANQATLTSLKNTSFERTTANPYEDIAGGATEDALSVEQLGWDITASIDESAQKGFELQVQSTTSKLNKAAKALSLYALGFRLVKQALTEAYQTITKLDKSLTEQAMVTGRTRKETYQLLGSYQQLAIQLGSTSKEVAEVATQYLRQGKTVQDALTLTEAAISAAKVAGISATDSVNYLTTALNGFRMSANDAMLVSDKFAAVAATSATSYDEIATALSKVASQANLAGMSIDYTTALLAKGLETTREAPETMGTALKTIIARMRELSDYGETLGGDTDINNVESQLSYVGIALRDVNGELRSTEDVLDELGRKWNTLNSNQQAAVAKALAGTRQQSRLIAMMSDYERVVELQQISARSAGATMAQMEVYGQSLEAAINRLNTSWESFIEALSNNELIIKGVDIVGNLISGITDVASSAIGLGTIIAGIGITIVGIVTNKIKTIKLNQQLRIIEKQRHAANLKAQAQEALAQQKKAKAEAESYRAKAQEAGLDTEAGRRYLAAAESMDKVAAAYGKIATDYGKEAAKQGEILSDELQQAVGSTSELQAQTVNFFDAMKQGLLMIPMLIQRITQARRKDNNELDRGLQKQKQKTTYTAAEQFAKYLGLAGAIVAFGLIGYEVGAAIIGAFKAGSTSTNDEIKATQVEIYKLAKTTSELKSVTRSFDDIDSNVIKTNEDLKEMNNLLDQAADKLSDEVGKKEDIGFGKGVSAKAYYEQFQTTAGRRQALTYIMDKLEQNRARLIQNNYLAAQSDLSDPVKQGAIFDKAYYNLQTAIDALELSAETEAAATEIIANMDIGTANLFAGDAKRTEEFARKLEKLNVAILNTNAPLTEQVAIWRQAKNVLDADEWDAFEKTYGGISSFFSKLTQSQLEFIDATGLSAEKLNSLYKSMKKLFGDEFQDSMYLEFLEGISHAGAKVEDVVKSVFGNLIDGVNITLNDAIRIFSDLIEQGILNMGQNIQTLKNSINKFYETATKWGEMSDAERADFLVSNAELFAGEDGAALLRAFESGDFAAIERALMGNKTLTSQYRKLLEQVIRELELEEAKTGDERNEAYIQLLKEYKSYLEDETNAFKASLAVRLEQENKELEQYKKLLQEESDALTKSLNDRKDAYQKYFDAISQEADDADYEEEVTTLVTNLAKLGSSTNAEAMKQSKELAQKLEDLEADRIKELRERAQEAILTNLEDEVNEISNTLDDLLNNSRLLLDALTGEGQGDLFARLVSSAVINQGLTSTGLEDFLATIRQSMGSRFSDNIWDAIKVEGSGSNLVLNVNGQTFELNTTDQQALYEQIMMALASIGIR